MQKRNDFAVLLLGNDINSYSLARAFYEAYGIKSTVMCQTALGPCGYSAICDTRVIPGVDRAHRFMPSVNGFFAEQTGKTVLILGCGDSYVEQIVQNKHKFPAHVIAPTIEKDLMDKLIRKKDFYELAEQTGVPYPKTFVYTAEMGKDYYLPFNFPVIAKPSDGVNYWQHPFGRQQKVWRAETRIELDLILGEIYAAGYEKQMIIQDTIPGDDSFMRVMTCLSDQNGKVILMSMGHPLLEEHTPHGLGNTSIILSDYDEDLSMSIKTFLESINYVGLSNFDMKLDSRDGKIKVFEVNCRQGRNNYYVTGGGFNLAKWLVEVFVDNKDLPFTITNVSSLWTVIPLGVAYKFVKDPKYAPVVKQMKKEGKMVNPLFMEGDRGFKRMRYLLKSHYSHYIKYWRYYR